ncbi:hypothetical protein ACOJBM_02240 [Rhizobium beringeri]
MFGGNIMLVIAAYNAGENRIITARGIPSIGETVSTTAPGDQRLLRARQGLCIRIRGTRLAGRAGPGHRQYRFRCRSAGVDAIIRRPLPINRTTTQSRHSDWIDGSVLYVQSLRKEPPNEGKIV